MNDRSKALTLVRDLMIKSVDDINKVEYFKKKRLEIKSCDCGSCFTNNPFHHYGWCKSQKESEILKDFGRLLERSSGGRNE